MIDLRRQRIFVAIGDKGVVDLDDVAKMADVSRQLVAKELKRLGWVKRVEGYVSPATIAMRARAIQK